MSIALLKRGLLLGMSLKFDPKAVVIVVSLWFVISSGLRDWELYDVYDTIMRGSSTYITQT
jgi:hypothetical protein